VDERIAELERMKAGPRYWIGKRWSGF